MNKKLVLIFLAGWGFSIIFSPSHILGMVSGKKTK